MLLFFLEDLLDLLPDFLEGLLSQTMVNKWSRTYIRILVALVSSISTVASLL